MIHVNCEVKTQHHHINHINPPEPIQIMTTFIPNLTLPAQVFSTPAISILLPVVLGAAVGYSVSRTYSFLYSFQACYYFKRNKSYYPCVYPSNSQTTNPKKISRIKTATPPPSTLGLRPRLDHPLWPHGILSLQSLDCWNYIPEPKCCRTGQGMNQKHACLSLLYANLASSWETCGQ